MNAEIPCCGICHIESFYMRYTIVKGESKTHICSMKCFKVLSELRDACEKLQFEAKKLAYSNESKMKHYQSTSNLKG